MPFGGGEEMRVFCFHSVRGRLAIPPAIQWQSQKFHEEFSEKLTVSPSWFFDWLDAAVKMWKDELVVTFDDAFSDVMVPAMLSAKMGIRTIVFVPTAHIGKVFPYAPYRVMSNVELRYVAAMGVELGSHGHNHVSWLEMPIDDVRMEMEVSRKLIQPLVAGLDQQTLTIAPPHGKFLPEHIRMTVDSGFGGVFGTHLYPVEAEGATPRCLANMEGYLNEAGEECTW